MDKKALEEVAETIRKEREHSDWLYDGAIAVSEKFIQLYDQNFQELWEYIKLRFALSRREVLEQQDQFILTR